MINSTNTANIDTRKFSLWKCFQVWILIAILPIITGKLILHFHTRQMAKITSIECHSKLRRDIIQFAKNTDIEYFLSNKLDEFNKQIFKSKIKNFTKIKDEFFKYSKKEFECNPFLLIATDNNFKKADVYPSYNRKSSVKIGKRAALIVLKYLKAIQNINENEIPDRRNKLFKQLCKPAFGSYTLPSKQMGVISSGFTEKFQGERIFIYYNRFYLSSQDKVLTYLIALKESDISQTKLFSWAKHYKKTHGINRFYKWTNSPKECGFTQIGESLFLKNTIPYSCMRYGSHKKKSIYDSLIKKNCLKQNPKFSLFLVNSTNISQISIRNISKITNLLFLLFLCLTLFIVRAICVSSKLAFSIRHNLLLAIIFAVVLPLFAFFLLSRQYIKFYSNLRINNRLKTTSQKLEVLELAIRNNDTSIKEQIERTRQELYKNVNQSKDVLKKILDKYFNKLYIGYSFVRNDGLIVEKLPTNKTFKKSDRKKLLFLNEVFMSQIIGVFKYAGLLRNTFLEKLSTPKGKKILALSELFSPIDRHSFCVQDGEAFSGKGTLSSLYKIVTYNLFSQASTSNLSAIMILLQSQKAIVSQLFKKNSSIWQHMQYRQDNILTSTAIFPTLDKKCNILDLSQSWPSSARKDKQLLEAAKRISKGKKYANWIEYLDNETPVLFVAKRLYSSPIIAVSRTIYTDNLTNSAFMNILFLFFIIYSVFLISIIASYLSNIFIEPIQILNSGAKALTKGKWPVLKSKDRNELSTVINKFNDMVKGIKEKQRLSRFLSKEVTSAVTSEIKESADFKNIKTNRAVFFIHIRHFAKLSDKYQPEKIIDLLNIYFKTTEPIISEFNGNIDKYMGDAIMVIFTGEQQCINACKTALKILSVLTKLNNELSKNELPRIQIGIGISYGKVLVAKIGSNNGRKDFTVIGDIVNLAARLESISHYDKNSHIMVSDALMKISKTHFKFSNQGLIKIKGKTKPIEVFELKTHKNE